MRLSLSVLCVSELNYFCNRISIDDHINLEISLACCLLCSIHFVPKFFKLLSLYDLNTPVRAQTFNCVRELLKNGPENSMSNFSECSSLFSHWRRLATDLGSRSLSCCKGRGGSEARTGLMNMSLLKDKGLTARSAFIRHILVTLRELLIFFSASTFPLVHLNSVKPCPRLIFVFPACCQSSSIHLDEAERF